jgi:ATP-dependent DNA ligase
MIDVQRPTEIRESELQAYLHNDTFALSQKMDGHRMIVKTGPIRCYTRQGLERDVPASVASALAGIDTEWIFDGEILDNTYHCFDILKTSKGDIRKWDWSQRQAILQAALSKREGIYVVQQVYGTQDKTAFFEKCVNASVEGVVFVKMDSPYRDGKGRNSLKYKLVKDVDCVVTDRGIDGKDNLELSVFRDGQPFVVGKVSALTGDGPKVNVGDVVTVSALYATPTGKLYLPVKPKIRTDKSPHECDYAQIEVIQTNKTIIEP